MTLKRYWIVDDDPIARMLIRKKMSRDVTSDECLEFANGQEALDKINSISPEEAPDLILLDLNMPILNGWEFLEECHKTIHEFEARIAILTSSIDENDLKKAKEFPCVIGFLNKPLNTNLLQELYQESLNLNIK